MIAIDTTEPFSDFQVAAVRVTETIDWIEYEGRVLASADVVEAAQGDEADNWEQGDEVTLRGRKEPTRLAYPRGGGGKREDDES